MLQASSIEVTPPLSDYPGEKPGIHNYLCFVLQKV